MEDATLLYESEASCIFTDKTLAVFETRSETIVVLLITFLSYRS